MPSSIPSNIFAADFIRQFPGLEKSHYPLRSIGFTSTICTSSLDPAKRSVMDRPGCETIVKNMGKHRCFIDRERVFNPCSYVVLDASSISSRQAPCRSYWPCSRSRSISPACAPASVSLETIQALPLARAFDISDTGLVIPIAGMEPARRSCRRRCCGLPTCSTGLRGDLASGAVTDGDCGVTMGAGTDG